MAADITPDLAERAWDLVHGVGGRSTGVTAVSRALGLSRAAVFRALDAHRPVYLAREAARMRAAGEGAGP